MTLATAVAQPNIALVKYWGKTDDDLNLPATGSLSITLDAFPTTTTVQPDPSLDADVLVLDGRVRRGPERERVAAFLSHVRALSGDSRHALVRTRNTAPTGAGLASSAAGFAALAVAASSAYGLDLDRDGLSRLARRGSGSASRSLIGGAAVWTPGDDVSSFARPAPTPDLALVIATVDRAAKSVSSREAMRRTRASSPFYPAWLHSCAEDLGAMLEACSRDDVERIGQIAEANALRMHAVALAATPSIRYLSPRSLVVLDLVHELRAEGVPAYATADAGPNPVVLCPPDHVDTVRDRLTGHADLTVARPGPGARLLPRDIDDGASE